MITLTQNGDKICLQVQDDGQGFDLAQISEQAPPLQRLGLLGVQERADLVGGQVTVESAPGQGTCMKICVPLWVTGDEGDG